MNTHHDIEEELKEMGSPLAGMSRKMPYELPEGYFAQFADQFMAVTGLIEIPDLPKTNMPFSIPEGYFEANPAAILKKLENEGLETLPSVMPFEVPEGYFDTLPAQIIAAAQSASEKTTAQKAPVKRFQLWGAVRWAAAAVLITGIGFGSYNILESPNNRIEHKLSKMSSDSLNAYVVQNIDEFDGEMIENNIAAAKNVKVNNFNDQIDKVDNDEIIQYLNETGGSIEKTETN